MSNVFKQLTGTCHKLLLKDKYLLRYLHARGLQDETISLYQLGAFPKDLRLLFEDNNPFDLREVGVIWNADTSPFQHHPIVIPIKNFMGEAIAIGARCIMSEDKRKEMELMKYRNSRYTKTAHLFGLDTAKESIRLRDKVFVVEGYFDKITAHQSGFKNVVATCGTLFSYRQLAVLSRYTNNVCLLFDNDEPGRKSVEQVINKLKDVDVNIEYKFTPDGFKDLDEFLQKGGDFNIFG